MHNLLSNAVEKTLYHPSITVPIAIPEAEVGTKEARDCGWEKLGLAFYIHVTTSTSWLGTRIVTFSMMFGERTRQSPNGLL